MPDNDLNSRVAITETYVKEIKDMVFRMEKINSNNREDFLEANATLKQTIEMQNKQDEKISALTDNVTKLTENVQQITVITAEMNTTKKTIDLLADDIKELKGEVADLKDTQRSQHELEREKTKYKYGL